MEKWSQYADSFYGIHGPIIRVEYVYTEGQTNMSNMVSKGSKYTDFHRKEAAIQYAISGNMKAVAKATGIPRTTIIGWKQAEWWDEMVGEIRHEKADEHRARYSELVDAAQQVALEKLPEASARDAMIIAATGTDKIRLHDGMPTEITGKCDDMKALAEQFKQLSRDHANIQNSVVATQEADQD